MKVLLLAYEQPDLLQDLICHGLAELLGPENVLVHPRIARFHSPPPPDLKHNAMGYLNLPRGPDTTLEELAAEADAVIVGSPRGSSLAGLRAIEELGLDKPRAAIDGLDDPYVRGAVRLVDVYFKRELLVRTARLRLRFPARRLYYAVRPHDMWDSELRRQVAVARPGMAKVVPLPFGVVPIGFPAASERTHDVTFLCAATDPLRGRIVEELRAMKAEGYRVLIPDDPLSESDRYRHETRLPWSTYMQALSSSRIAVSVRGDGFDTYRYWEIPYAGALLLSETPRTVIPDNFANGVEAVFAEPERLCDEARRLLDSQATEPIAAAGHARLMSAHLSRHRAEVVLERLTSVRRRPARARVSPPTPR
jgi:hypothetical protein